MFIIIVFRNLSLTIDLRFSRLFKTLYLPKVFCVFEDRGIFEELYPLYRNISLIFSAMDLNSVAIV